MNIEGRVVLVTGGSTGIGLAIARAFVERKSTVIVCGRDSERLSRAKRDNPALELRHPLVSERDFPADPRRALSRIPNPTCLGSGSFENPAESHRKSRGYLRDRTASSSQHSRASPTS